MQWYAVDRDKLSPETETLRSRQQQQPGLEASAAERAGREARPEQQDPGPEARCVPRARAARTRRHSGPEGRQEPKSSRI